MSVLEFSRLREDPGWLERVVIRPVTAADLPLLEWEGEYLHFRRVFAGAFERQLAGLSVLWIAVLDCWAAGQVFIQYLSLIHISEPTRLLSISYAVFCLKKKKKKITTNTTSKQLDT